MLRRMIIATLLTCAWACSENRPSIEVTPAPALGAGGQAANALVEVTLDTVAMASLSGTSGITYNLSFLTVTQNGPAQAVGGAVTLTGSGYASGQTGDLSAQVYQGGLMKLSGSLKGIQLAPGSNLEHIALTAVAASGNTATATTTSTSTSTATATTADASVSVTIGTGTATATGTSP